MPVVPRSIRVRVLIWSAGVLATALLAGCGGNGAEGGGTVANTSERVPAPAGVSGSQWPYFGRVPQRTHYLPSKLNPPLKQLWSFNDKALLEFPPAVAHGILYVSNQYGDVRAIRAKDGKTVWDLFNNHRTMGVPVDVTGPAYSQGHVYVARVDGLLLSLDAKTGRPVWHRRIPSQLESSPLVIGERLFIGSDHGVLYALDKHTGKTVWAFHTVYPVRASASFDRGVIYGADYGGNMFALRESDGHVLWKTDTSKLDPRGGFYSSPALGNGLVYAGRDDGTVFALHEKTGKPAWQFPTGTFMYGSPAVARVPGTKPTVYIGSYDGYIYALDALSGKQLWRHHTGPVPGTAVVIGRTVYTSSFKERKAFGIDVKSHRKVFSYESPGYTPMVSDGRSLFLVGYFSLHRLVPR